MADRQAVALIVFPAFIVQAIAGVFALAARDSIAGTLMLSFATTWLIDALVFYVHPPGAAAALGVFYVVVAVFISFMLASALANRRPPDAMKVSQATGQPVAIQPDHGQASSPDRYP